MPERTEAVRGMVGRDRELGVLLDAWRALEDGCARCIAVSGELGIGKTLLFDELIARVGHEGAVVVQGRASDLERDVPYALLVDALEVHPDVLWPEPYPAHQAVRTLIEEVAASRRLVLALDDLQWADAASADLIAHLLRRRPAAPVLLLIAYRSLASSAELSTALEAASREGWCEMLELEPLTEAQAGDLLGDDVAPPLRRLLFEESGGNPLYLDELARAPVPEATARALALETAQEPDFDIPRRVSASLLQEVERLSGPARRLLEAAAVVGAPFEPEVAGEVAQLDEQAGLAALDELIAAGFVRPTELPRRFAFRRPIVGRAVAESMAVGRRLTAHERAAELLAGHGEPAAVIARHAERAARRGDMDAVRLLTKAATQGTRSPEIAARWLATALRLLPLDAPAERRLELLIALGDALASAGRLDASDRALSEALGLMPGEMSQRLTRVVSVLTRTDELLSRGSASDGLLAAALDRAGPAQARERAALTLELSVDRLRAGSIAAAADAGAEALRCARRAGDRPLHGAAAAALGLVEHAAGAVAAARECALEAGAVVDELSDDELSTRLIAGFHLPMLELALGDHQRAIEHAERALDVARGSGQALLIVPLRLPIGWAQLWLGRLGDAARTAEAMREAARVLGIEQYAGWASALAASVAVEEGDIAEALAAGEEAVRHSARVPRGLFGHLSHFALAEACVAADRPERAIEALLTPAGGADLALVEAGARPRWYAVLAEAELARGRAGKADTWIRRAERALDQADLPVQSAAVARVRAMVMLAGGRARDAAAEARDAVETFARKGMALEASRSRTLLARCLADAGETEAAVATLERAYRELDLCGARRARDEAALQLRRLAGGVPRRARAAGEGFAALSAREREVAALVADGKTNKAIGAELFVGERTVETHVSRIMRKLGVSSRTGVAREVERRRSTAG